MLSLRISLSQLVHQQMDEILRFPLFVFAVLPVNQSL